MKIHSCYILVALSLFWENISSWHVSNLINAPQITEKGSLEMHWKFSAWAKISRSVIYLALKFIIVALVYTYTYSKPDWHMPILIESPCIWPTAANNDVLIKPKNGSCQIWDASNFALWSKKREAKKDNTDICIKWKWKETTHYHYMEIKMIFPFTLTPRKLNKHFWNLYFVASRSYDNFLLVLSKMIWR